MPVTEGGKAPWLLLVFTLPAAKASERVGIWRKLQRYGALSLPASGNLLPNNTMNQERFEWLATSIRNAKGQAAVAQVFGFDDLRHEQIEQMFNQARARDYQELQKELKKITKGSRGIAETALARIKRRMQQIVEIDFFGSPARAGVEEAVHRLERGDADAGSKVRHNAKDYIGRTWITRPRPGIDRVASAWLIRRFIDADARFIFDADASRHADAIPFDMFQSGGFGHQGNDCTFETLMKSFAIRDRRVALVAQAIHDADLADEHFGRDEALGIDRILEGWAAEGTSDEELLRRGMEMIEGLYKGIR
jgi:hypothetical protein